ncbi:complement component-related sushi domain-containing [Holotrichia oblita]|uniref:Complement component-related sushi domain-containing n=1 Tax=Holotrichia oblita TaxID=644536 RepID=A0ACB9TMJ3_HOLOL|nr:complement component-related sushi domain-containing [Holotrichia oblita]
MVRRKKQRSRAKFTGQQMTAAGQEVKTNGTSLRVTAEMFNINFLTLRRYVLKERDNPDAKMVPNYAVRLVFEPQQDALLCSYIKPCSKMGFGLDTSKVRQLAYEMAVKKQYNDTGILENQQKRKQRLATSILKTKFYVKP